MTPNRARRRRVLLVTAGLLALVLGSAVVTVVKVTPYASSVVQP